MAGESAMRQIGTAACAQPGTLIQVQAGALLAALPLPAPPAFSLCTNHPHHPTHPPPGAGTGKTLIARACAAQTNATFLKLAGPTLVQMFIGDGAKMVRDAFALAKEKSPAIIFIDEIDAIGAGCFHLFC